MNTHLAEFKVCFVHASECIHMQDDAEPDKQTGTHTHTQINMPSVHILAEGQGYYYHNH